MNKTIFDASMLAFALDRTMAEPLQVQLAGHLRRLILTGRAGPGARLPSSRVLADELSVSRVTIVAAMEQLISEGYAESRRGSGLYVSGDLPENLLQVALVGAPPASPPPTSMAMPVPVRPFQAGAPDPALFPHREWARLLDTIWRRPEPALLANADPLGWAPLRAAIAEHLNLWRGIACGPHQVIVTSGAVEAINLLARTVFRSGDRVLIEEPGYRAMRRALELNGLQCQPVPVDAHGFDTTSLTGGANSAMGAVVTPSRHYPLGATLPLSRRLELLDWARRTGGIVIEDDFDSEYRYRGRPLPALMSLDDDDCVVYIGSFSKVLSSSLRLGFMVVPDKMLAGVAGLMAETGTSAALIAQPVLARFMADGGFAAHIRRMRRIYARRQSKLLAVAAAYLDGLLDMKPAAAGMHLIAELTPALAARMNDASIAARAAGSAITVQPLSSFYAGNPLRQGLVMGFAGFDEAEIEAGAERLGRVLRQ